MIMYAVLCVEQFWNVHPQKLDNEIFRDSPSMEIGSIEIFQLYGSTPISISERVTNLQIVQSSS